MAWMDYETINFKSDLMKDLMNLVEQGVTYRTPCLVTGEAGAGKTSMAKYALSRSCGQGRFVTHDCSHQSIESLLEFLPSTNMPGVLFENVDLLDLNQQEILKEFVQNNRAHYHFLFTSLADLKSKIKEGKFSSQLYFNIAVIHLRVPSLWERSDDYEILAQYFLDLYRSLYSKTHLKINTETLDAIYMWDWPGNLREFESFIERSVLLSTDLIDFNELMRREQKLRQGQGLGVSLEQVQLSDLNLANVERTIIHRALQLTGQNRTHAANMLGITVRTLRNKLAEYKEKGGSNEFTL